MSVLIFIGILLVLIVGHEFGHLIVAKLSGMKVPEFGVGFPPKLWGKKIGETEYTVNALPFGGFVKIFGEDDADAADPRAFARRPRALQAATLFAGPFSNLILGFILSTTAFMVGIPSVITDASDMSHVRDAHVRVAEVLPHSPAALAGIRAGDEIVSVSSSGKVATIQKPEDVLQSIGSAKGALTIELLRSGKKTSVAVTPAKGIDVQNPERLVIGIAPALVGTLSLPLAQAFIAGVTNTFTQTKEIIIGMGALIGHVVTFSADLSNIAGPVGIVSLVGDASGFGLGSVLALAALISMNLAIV
ncbi:MAG: site-2 protease family protein, partial [Patescibacteria group bacterium]